MRRPLSSASGKIELNRPWHHKLASVEPVVGFSLSPVDCYLVAGTGSGGGAVLSVDIFFFSL